MKKSIKIILGIILLVLVIGGGLVYYINSNLALDEVPAVLYADGVVSVLRAGLETNVDSQYILEEKDIIKTGSNSAKIVFYDSIFVFIDPNSEVSVESLMKDNVQIGQSSGSTWNKITKLFNAKDYSVKTPNSVASVRGTEFEIAIGDNPDDVIVTLVDGEILIDNGKEQFTIKDFGKANSTKEGITQLEFTQEDRDRLVEKVKKTKLDLKINRNDMAKRIFDKNQATISKVESATGETITLDKASELFDDVDNGKTSFDELKSKMKSKVPFVKTDFIDEFKSISDEIKKQDAILNKVNSK